MENVPALFESELEEEKHYRSYLPSSFITASLPLRDVKAPNFQRKFNNIELYLTGSPKVPYGKYARLLLSILTTRAVLSDSKDSVKIHYARVKDLTDEMLLPKQRGKDVKEQLMLFSLSTFQYREKISKKVQKALFEEYQNDSGCFEATWNSHGNIAFMKNLQWIDLKDLDDAKKETESIGFTIELSKDFADLCKNHSVPIDYTVYSKIPSALGKDLYAWLIYRNNVLREGEELFIPRDSIIEQFCTQGEETSSNMTTSLYARICERINEIKSKYYKSLKIEYKEDGSGFILKKSPPVINAQDKRYILITNDI